MKKDELFEEYKNKQKEYIDKMEKGIIITMDLDLGKYHITTKDVAEIDIIEIVSLLTKDFIDNELEAIKKKKENGVR